jgi:hypothetical protein
LPSTRTSSEKAEAGSQSLKEARSATTKVLFAAYTKPLVNGAVTDSAINPAINVLFNFIGVPLIFMVGAADHL